MARSAATLKEVLASAEKLLTQEKRARARLSSIFVDRITDMVDVTSNLSLDESQRKPVDAALAETRVTQSEYAAFAKGMAITLGWLRGQLTDEVLDDFERLRNTSSARKKVQGILVAGVAYSYVFVITRVLACTLELESICRHGANAGTKARLEALAGFVASTAVDEAASWARLDLIARLGQLIASMGNASPAPIGAMEKSGKWIAQQRELAAAFKAWRKASIPLMLAANEQMRASIR